MSRSYYTTAEAAAELGVTAGRVRQMVLNGEIAAEKKGRDILIAHEAVVKAAARKKTPGPSKCSRSRKSTSKRNRPT